MGRAAAARIVWLGVLVAPLWALTAGVCAASGPVPRDFWSAPEEQRLLGPGLVGSWFDFLRGIWFVIETTGKGYRVTPILLERDEEGRLRNRFEGLTLTGTLTRGTLGFRGEGRPTGEPQGRTWLFEGSVERRRGLDRLDGDIRIETAPYPSPPLPSRRLSLHLFTSAPTLSVFEAGRPRPQAAKPPPAPERGLALSVDIQYLQLPGGVPQEGKPRRTQPPSSLRLIERSGETWKLNRDAIW